MFCDFQSSVRLQERISPKVFVFLFPRLFALVLLFFSIVFYLYLKAAQGWAGGEHCSWRSTAQLRSPVLLGAAQLRSISRGLPARLWWSWLYKGEIPVRQQRKLPNYGCALPEQGKGCVVIAVTGCASGVLHFFHLL